MPFNNLVLNALIKKSVPTFSCIFLGVFLTFCQPKDKELVKEQAPVDTELIKKNLLATAANWNKGDLVGFVSLYDSAATFMTPAGLIGLDTLKAHYQKKYFKGSIPNQQLTFNELQVKALGEKYALVTGRYMLTDDKQPAQSGRFSLVFNLTPAGWKIIHDQSS